MSAPLIPQPQQTSAPRPDERMDHIMGTLLRAGVSISAAIVILGGIIFLLHNPLPSNDHVFRGEPTDLRTLSGILRDALAFRGRGLIQLGLLCLIATPVARVTFSVFAFLHEKDWTYVGVTLFVLALLGYSLLGGHF